MEVKFVFVLFFQLHCHQTLKFLSDCNGTRTQNHLFRKRTLKHLASFALNFRFRTCFEQGFSWHSGNYRMWIHSETYTWHDNNIHSVKISLSAFMCANAFLYFVMSYFFSVKLIFFSKFMALLLLNSANNTAIINIFNV